MLVDTKIVSCKPLLNSSTSAAGVKLRGRMSVEFIEQIRMLQ